MPPFSKEKESKMDRLQRSHQSSIYDVLDRIYNLLRWMQRQMMVGSLNSEDANKDLDEALANLTRLESSNILPNEDLKTAIRSIKEFKEALPTKLNSHNEPGINQYDRTKPKPNGRGRPEFEIDISKLQQLLELGFTVKQIANDGLLGGVLHPNTLYKKLRENNIKIRSYSNIGDEDLQELVVKYNRDHPNAGAMEIQAYLKSNGHNIQRQRCRDMLLSVDSAGTATRWSRTIQRRQYSVPTANSVWHVDTHHSLARWGIVVHGAIDGYSRLIPFMRASTYNTSKAAACFFVEGVQNFGVPSRVRADHGTEYADTGRFMIQVNGEDRGSFLTGPSVHNQRIERLWRDVYMKVIDTFYKLFLYMEDEKVLDIGNEIHKWVLQYVFTPRIDAALKEWMRTHNNHKIRTENNRTPNMLWFQSLLLSNPDKFTSARNIDSPPEEKIEMAIQTLNLELDDKTFLRPRQSCPLMEDAIQDLASRIDVNKESESHGLDVFREVMLYVLLKQ